MSAVPLAKLQTFSFMWANKAATQQWYDREGSEADLDYLFTEREFRNKKDGLCYVPALIPDTRAAANVWWVFMLVFDIDGAQSLAEVIGLVRAFGVRGWVYSTHSHMARETNISVAHYDRWAQRERQPATPTLASMRLYCTVNKKEHLVSSLTFDPRDCDGRNYKVGHVAVHKVRVVIPLAQPIDPRQCDFAATYKATGEAIGLAFDPTCAEPARLFYFPSCPPEMAEHAYAESVPGPWCDPTPYIRSAPPPREYKRGEPREAGPPVDVSGVNLRHWHANHDPEFDIEALIADKIGDVIRIERNRGGFILECPYEAEHTHPGGAGCFAANGGDGYAWTIHCRHNACEGEGRKRLDFVAEWLRQGRLTLADLGFKSIKLPVLRRKS